MIERWFVTGDCHREFSRFKNYPDSINNDKTAIIILGDAGINYMLDEHDSQIKNYLTKRFNFHIYCVRGNHEARPQDVENMILEYDENVQGEVYYQKKWPRIKYFKDWGLYTIGDYRVAVIGGAYSVDKEWRLYMKQKWFENEQLSDDEMLECTADLMGQEVDFVFTHTCPICWEPTDLFLGSVDQSKVDKSMELFLEEVAKVFRWKIWCFGHYHADRMERPYVEQYSKDTEELCMIAERWKKYKESNELDWWLVKSPNFYYDDPIEEGNYFD